MSEEHKTMTTDAGRPVGDNQNSLTVGPRGPVVLEDYLLFEKMAHFNRERIPERVVHAKGSGAYGYFICTKPLAEYTTAKLFSNQGKKTPKSTLACRGPRKQLRPTLPMSVPGSPATAAPAALASIFLTLPSRLFSKQIWAAVSSPSAFCTYSRFT